MADSGIFVYVSCAESREIRVLRLNPVSGELSRVHELGVSGNVMPMAVSPDRRFLFAALRSEPYSVASFAIDQLSGTLTHLGNAPLPQSALYLSVDASGRYLFATSIPVSKARRHSSLSVSPIGPHGFVQPPHQAFRAEPKIHSIVPDPTNRWVLAASCINDQLLRYSFDATTGLMSPSAVSSVRVITKAGPRHMIFHPNGRFFYLLNETDATLYAFGYDRTTGMLSELQIVDTTPPGFQEEPQGADLHLTPDGKLLYASERISSTLAAFRVDGAGMLEHVGNFATEKCPRSFSIDPYGRYLLAVGQHSHALSAYAIEHDTGNLRKLAEYPMGKAPGWVEIVRL